MKSTTNNSFSALMDHGKPTKRKTKVSTSVPITSPSSYYPPISSEEERDQWKVAKRATKQKRPAKEKRQEKVDPLLAHLWQHSVIVDLIPIYQNNKRQEMIKTAVLGALKAAGVQVHKMTWVSVETIRASNGRMFITLVSADMPDKLLRFYRSGMTLYITEAGRRTTAGTCTIRKPSKKWQRTWMGRINDQLTPVTQYIANNITYDAYIPVGHLVNVMKERGIWYGKGGVQELCTWTDLPLDSILKHSIDFIEERHGVRISLYKDVKGWQIWQEYRSQPNSIRPTAKPRNAPARPQAPNQSQSHAEVRNEDQKQITQHFLAQMPQRWSKTPAPQKAAPGSVQIQVTAPPKRVVAPSTFPQRVYQDPPEGPMNLSMLPSRALVPTHVPPQSPSPPPRSLSPASVPWKPTGKYTNRRLQSEVAMNWKEATPPTVDRYHRYFVESTDDHKDAPAPAPAASVPTTPTEVSFPPPYQVLRQVDFDGPYSTAPSECSSQKSFQPGSRIASPAPMSQPGELEDERDDPQVDEVPQPRMGSWEGVPIGEWNPDQVADWLRSLGPNYWRYLDGTWADWVGDGVDGKILMEIGTGDKETCEEWWDSLDVKKKLHRKKIRREIRGLTRKEGQKAETSPNN